MTILNIHKYVIISVIWLSFSSIYCFCSTIAVCASFCCVYQPKQKPRKEQWTILCIHRRSLWCFVSSDSNTPQSYIVHMLILHLCASCLFESFSMWGKLFSCSCQGSNIALKMHNQLWCESCVLFFRVTKILTYRLGKKAEIYQTVWAVEGSLTWHH